MPFVSNRELNRMYKQLDDKTDEIEKLKKQVFDHEEKLNILMSNIVEVKKQMNEKEKKEKGKYFS